MSVVPRDAIVEFDPRRNERLIRSDPARYSEMVRNITEFGVYLIDRDGLVQSWNQGAANITGFAEHEIVGQPFSALFADSALRDNLPIKALQFVRTHRHSHDEHWRRRRSGEEFVALSTLDAVRAESGELIGFVEVFTDITELKRREDDLYRRATRDELTGIFNRGHFMEIATQEIERARRFVEPLSLLMLDIDHFKGINDTYGHPVGDQVIVLLANTCVGAIRKIDFIGRVGGEEFAITLPRANKDPAYVIAQRLRLKISEQRIELPGHSLGFTVSIGLATLRPHTRNLLELIRCADAALYKAKREGRNRVEAWFE